MLRLLAPLCALVLAAGCVGPDPPPAATTPVGPDATTPSADAPSKAATSSNGSATPTSVSLPIALDGSVGTQAFLCLQPVGECLGEAVQEGKSDLLFEGEAGRVAGGELVLSWNATTPATQELSMGVMLMRGEGEACAPVSLASGKGGSPLALAVPAATRALCPSDILHVWVSGANYGASDATYYQVDTDQAFHLGGWLELAPT